ncbi:MAG: cyclic nucleotide-binding domain-containing protein [Balneolaceae bacterium]|nr:cyclic nucleotide-binding domain-containing protein [Balneolaceae bacterium]MBO6545324.1 cyclic nucleotide-binding domain-containing protein [Balneolaceae bacterium]MBO6646720.1 cyclic nucleotide-binding domain-containing protein [Balneolaceae bacterium]
MEDFIVSSLRQIPNFKEVPEHQLRWFAQNSELCTYQPDEVIFKPGDEINYMFIVLDGSLRAQIKRGNQFTPLITFEKGNISGKLPFSRMQSSAAFITSLEESTILKTAEKILPEISKHYELIEVFVHSLSDRIRTFTTQQQQNEKMVALGKLSAGLAHELNNPASAMVRGATELRKRLRSTPDKFKAVMNIRLTEEQVDAVNELVFKKVEKGSSNQQSLMNRTALEDDLADWMEDRGVDQGFEYAETFAEYCFNIDDLEFVSSHVEDEYLPAVLGWVEDVLTTEKMVEEIEDSATRISDLVSSVKTYSHMDRGSDKEVVDLRKMLKSTITMLNHKSKQKKVEISMDIPDTLPEFCGFVSELNQVWTNLIDNAIDAVDESGEIKIEALSKNGDLILKFNDNGSGIPEDIQNKIFDPFFTTKDVGQGTGLGLDVVHKIIEKHGGRIEVKSQPGDTTFELTFPLS